jgi:hypothetical protein
MIHENPFATVPNARQFRFDALRRQASTSSLFGIAVVP